MTKKTECYKNRSLMSEDPKQMKTGHRQIKLGDYGL